MAELSIRYATALFELSKESGSTNEYLEQAVFLRETLQDENCQRIITHPHIKTEEKYAFLEESFSKSLHSNLMGFLKLVIDKNRESYLLPALSELIEMIRSDQRKTTASVISPVMLDETQINSLKALLSKKLNKEVDLNIKVDPEIIGGLHIQVDGYFIDKTIKKVLKDMKLSLKRSTANDSEA